MKRKLDEIAGTDASGPGELFRIFVYPEELVKLLELGREQFERAAVGLFVQIKMDKVFIESLKLKYGILLKMSKIIITLKRFILNSHSITNL